MLSLRQLIIATPKPIITRSLTQCRVRITHATENLDDFGNTVKECGANVRATDGDRFALILFYEPEKKLEESKVWLHCSCPWYTFALETVNSMKRSSDVINSTGAPPVIRNPRMIPGVCKHLAALARVAIKAKYKAIGQLALEQKEQKQFDEKAEKEVEERKENERKAGKKPEQRVPPARILNKHSQQPGKQALKRPQPLRTGPRPPAGPKSVQRPKSIQGPKPIKRPGQR